MNARGIARQAVRVAIWPEETPRECWRDLRWYALAGLLTGPLVVILFGCAVPRTEPVAWEQLDCLGVALAESGAPESLIAEFGDCDQAELAQVTR